MGAVGLDKVVVHLNNNYRVLDKATGATLSTVSIDDFWSSTGAVGPYDPRVIYDPFNQRWIAAAISNGGTSQSSVLVAVSETSYPSGNWFRFRFAAGCAAGAGGCNAQGETADFPTLGFNKNWVDLPALTNTAYEINGPR